MTARLLARRWALYLLTCAGVFTLQALFYTLSHVRMADFYANLIGPPLVIVVVTVFVGADATNTMTVAQRWERVLERGWAIIIFDVALSLVQTGGLQTMMSGGANLGDVIMGFLTLLLAAMLVYAEPFIALENDTQSLTLLPFAILRSMMLAWVNLSRVFSLFAVQIAAVIASLFVHQAVQTMGWNATLWADLPFWTLVAAPLAALYTLAYLDTVAQERNSAA